MPRLREVFDGSCRRMDMLSTLVVPHPISLYALEAVWAPPRCPARPLENLVEATSPSLHGA